MPEIEKIQKNTKYIFLWKEWGVIIIGLRQNIRDQEELELEIQYSHRLPSCPVSSKKWSPHFYYRGLTEREKRTNLVNKWLNFPDPELLR